MATDDIDTLKSEQEHWHRILQYLPMDEGWHVVGWTGKDSALLRSGTESLNVTSRHVEMIGVLESAIRRMLAAVPGGTHCDPQMVADELRSIAQSVGVDVSGEERVE